MYFTRSIMKEKLHELGQHFNMYPSESTQYKVCFDDSILSPLFVCGFVEKAKEYYDIDPKTWFIERCELNNNNLIFGTDAI